MPSRLGVHPGLNQQGGVAFRPGTTRTIAGSGRPGWASLLDGSLDQRAIRSARNLLLRHRPAERQHHGNFSAKRPATSKCSAGRGLASPAGPDSSMVRTVGPPSGVRTLPPQPDRALSAWAMVAVFMVVRLRLARCGGGDRARLYALFNLAIYALIPVTLTLPGIAVSSLVWAWRWIANVCMIF